MENIFLKKLVLMQLVWKYSKYFYIRQFLNPPQDKAEMWAISLKCLKISAEAMIEVFLLGSF